MSWWESLKAEVKLDEPLKKHTTFKIGGPAKFFIEPKDVEDLRLLLSLARRNKMPFLMIGWGSNLLVSDKGIRSPVIKLSSPDFKKNSFQGDIFTVGAGCLLCTALKKAQEHSFSGLEFLTGIPGTVGGALVMNAGVPGKSIGDLVEDVTIMDYNGSVKNLKRKDLGFGYRVSSLSKYIVLSARLKLHRGKKRKIGLAIKKYLLQRKEKQDLYFPSAGCVFKNPSLDSAGRLIDSCGLKGKRIGDACVSAKHANFIVNLGKAKAGDVLALMGLIKKEVKRKFNISLEPEIKIWK